jgi:hypothetical protein
VQIGIDKQEEPNSQAARCQFRKRQPAVLFLMIGLACGVSSAETSKLHPPSKDEAGALRLDKPANPGDIVEIRMGRASSKNGLGKVNVLIDIRQQKEAPASHCSWDPPQDFLWRRVLYCDWMRKEGWTLKKGAYNTWLKRPAATVQ